MPHRRRNLLFFGNLAEKASCVDDKTVLFRYTYSEIVFQNLPQIRITTLYGRIISKKAKIRIGYGQSVPGGMSDHVLYIIIISVAVALAAFFSLSLLTILCAV